MDNTIRSVCLTVALATVTLAALAGCAHKQEAKTSNTTASLSEPRPTVARRPVDDSGSSTLDHEPSTNRGGNAIYFTFEDAVLDSDARPTLQQLAAYLKANPSATLRVEGNCDERGTTEYNLALGDARARAAMTYLENLGVPARRITFVSFGKERPRYQGHEEAAWSKNRRDDLVVR
jgi:peptidoglycan-associated lipoprotein